MHLVLSVGLALARFEPALRFVDHVNAALATHNAAITVPVLERAERIANFHVPILPSAAPPSGQKDQRRVTGDPNQGPVNFMVGDTGIEPVTPSMSTKCSTAELITHCVTHSYAPNKNGARNTRQRRCYKRSRAGDQGAFGKHTDCAM